MTFMMTADRYSSALYDVAVDSGELADVKRDMVLVRDIFVKLPALRQYCFKSRVAVGDSLKMLEIVFLNNVTAKTMKTFEIMASNGRIASLPFMPDAFLKVSESHENTLHAVVEFAYRPDDAILADIGEKMRKRTGKEVNLELHIEPFVLGGFRIKWSNRIIDNSALGRIRQLAQALKNV